MADVINIITVLPDRVEGYFSTAVYRAQKAKGSSGTGLMLIFDSSLESFTVTFQNTRAIFQSD